ncbi:SusC/RagA family TonB-linked outer membrane protein [Sphingobacterium sp. lm-10]|uniref:SusC/RagA family TonB-linked outer membrane protein n=1 Tax=Sphingobacterium sp. lm-10 TaxID=2944904 RepID=UPI0020228E99|nr:SusC/RagA family TonB-linked outer membrane protein [Sphingobacterium sp. lm-10]MCL7987813.1 SusC/RagA family TonB-linked outer membrane protein [Sphingobacterium sp. lm-10]
MKRTMAKHSYPIILLTCIFVWAFNTLHAHALPPLGSTVLADSIQVQGKITDSVGMAIAGAVITEKGTSNSVTSNAAGEFKIDANPNGALLVLKSPYAVKEVFINNQRQLDFALTVTAAAEQLAAEARADSIRNVTDTVSAVAAQSEDSTRVSTPVAATDTVIAGSSRSGVVSGPSGPLGGVSVQVQGTSNTVSTDSEGRFQLTASSEQILEFTSLGFQPVRQPVGDRATIQVVMTPETNTIESVNVVAVGYGTMRRETLPTAVSSIGSDEIENEVLPSISQAIQGKAGGVQVTQKSGSPGGGLNIRVRGTTSINASSDPLYVVDGIPVNSTTNFTGGSTFDFGGGTQGINILASINPSDVQSVEILKDAASSSIYGARAANGVVLITTKKGTAGTSEFSFNMYEGFSQVPRERYYDMMNTSQYQDYMRDFYAQLQRQAQVLDPNAVVTIPEQILSNSNINTNWQDEIFRTAPTRNYEISSRGGSERTQYYTSFGYMRQGGTLLYSDFNRLSGRLNLDHQHNDKLRFSTAVNVTRAMNLRVQEENSREGATKSGFVSPPNLPVFDEAGRYVYDEVITSRENPVAMLQLPTNEAQTFRILANGQVDYNFIPSLTLMTRFGVDVSFIDETFFMPPTGLRAFTAQRGVGARRNTRDQLWINETTLTFDKQYGDHHINALAGFSLQESRLEFVHGQRSNFVDNDVNQIVAGGIITGANAFPEEWAIASGFGRVNYVLQDRYILNANIRWDGSSRFGADNRWAVFPAFAAAWRISEEDFLKDSQTLSDLKLRASWGKTGNQNIGNYASYTLYSAGNNYIGSPGFIPNILGDTQLKWETTTQTDIGVDFSLFNNRISVLADYYYKRTSDLLISVPVRHSLGFTNRFTNFGEIENKGFEFELTSRNLVGDFRWTTSFNMTFNRNKVLSLPDGVDEMLGGVGDLNIARPGLPLGSFSGWQTIGVNPQTGMIDYLGVDGNVVLPTEYRDRTVIGDPNPDFFGGITNNFYYKNIDLSIMGQFSYGNDIFNYNLFTALSGFNNSSNGLVDWVDRWRQPGDITDVPRVSPGDLNNATVSDRFVEDGSFFRLRNITLGYTFSEGLNSRLRTKGLRWYFTVQNAFVFTKYRGYDPEVASSHGGANTGLIYGYDYGSYPQPRIFTTGINLTF